MPGTWLTGDLMVLQGTDSHTFAGWRDPSATQGAGSNVEPLRTPPVLLLVSNSARNVIVRRQRRRRRSLETVQWSGARAHGRNPAKGCNHDRPLFGTPETPVPEIEPQGPACAAAAVSTNRVSGLTLHVPGSPRRCWWINAGSRRLLWILDHLLAVASYRSLIPHGTTYPRRAFGELTASATGRQAG